MSNVCICLEILITKNLVGFSVKNYVFSSQFSSRVSVRECLGGGGVFLVFCGLKEVTFLAQLMLLAVVLLFGLFS